jgi:hypothetical protein
MVIILIEGVLFVALLAAVGALVMLGVRNTGAGRWFTQTRNRRRIERRAEVAAVTRCPTHGSFRERDLVRLPGGGQVCPQCYAELFDDAQ